MITKTNFEYSLKNVPIPPRTTHLRGIIASTERFIQNARWKCYYHLNPKQPTDNPKPHTNYYGFKSPNSAKKVNELVAFEKDLNHLISSLEYTDYKNPFQKQLQRDVKKINNSPNLFIQADKTSNLYEIDPETYKNLLQDNVTQCYKKEKPTDKTVYNINKEAKSLTKELKIDDRVEVMAKKEAYITIKDHKPLFPQVISCRLINPCKSNIGRITKRILDRINREIRFSLKLNQLPNTAAAIKWFENIQDKDTKSLTQIDLKDFYPSVTRELFDTTLEFAETITTINSLEKDLLLNARKSVLHHDDAVWTKRPANSTSLWAHMTAHNSQT